MPPVCSTSMIGGVSVASAENWNVTAMTCSMVRRNDGTLRAWALTVYAETGPNGWTLRLAGSGPNGAMVNTWLDPHLSDVSAASVWNNQRIVVVQESTFAVVIDVGSNAQTDFLEAVRDRRVPRWVVSRLPEVA